MEGSKTHFQLRWPRLPHNLRSRKFPPFPLHPRQVFTTDPTFFHPGKTFYTMGPEMHQKETEPSAKSTKAYILIGIFTVIPIVITWLILKFVFLVLRDFGVPVVSGIARAIIPYWPQVAEFLGNPWFDSILAVILVLVGLYLLGWTASRVIGRRLLALFDALVHRIPLVNTIYISIQKFLSVLQHKPDGVQRVVLIEFPSPGMKTVGFVTRTLVDSDTGRDLAAVYVPTTPNPTSGYLEIVPLEKVISTDWTCLLYTSPSPRDRTRSRMPSSA